MSKIYDAKAAFVHKNGFQFRFKSSCFYFAAADILSTQKLTIL